jgi:chorismate mutase
MKELRQERKKIDKIDNKIVKLLEKRFGIVNRLKKLKKKNSINMEDKRREKEIKLRYKNSKLPKCFVDNFFNLLFKEAKK